MFQGSVSSPSSTCGSRRSCKPCSPASSSACDTAQHNRSTERLVVNVAQCQPVGLNVASVFPKQTTKLWKVDYQVVAQ